MSHSALAFGSVVSLWRYPVKSMLGEELNAAQITDRGLLGDRAYALLDSSDGKVASAKNPRKWPQLFDFRAAFLDTPRVGATLPPVRITLPDGTLLSSTQSDLNRILSGMLTREVTLEASEGVQREIVESPSPNPWTPKAEEYCTFFDCAVVHVLTTATLDRLRELYPQGRFEVRRFRPNIILQAADGIKDFVENAWIDHTLAIGDEVRLSITGPCPRCVMTTLPQGDLPKDPGILRTAAQHNQVNVGVYASVLRGGTVHRGDAIRLEES